MTSSLNPQLRFRSPAKTPNNLPYSMGPHYNHTTSPITSHKIQLSKVLSLSTGKTRPFDPFPQPHPVQPRQPQNKFSSITRARHTPTCLEIKGVMTNVGGWSLTRPAAEIIRKYHRPATAGLVEDRPRLGATSQTRCCPPNKHTTHSRVELEIN